ncbi:MAG: NAD-dependent epimerase/dehydratase family protein [Anaerolineae bacterium]|nr:NAD-dependent epimerase/dehydratase family protein [Anaerolineae bacterium]
MGRWRYGSRRRGARVTGLARDPARAGFLSEAGVEVVQGDIGDPERLRAQVAGAEVVFHLAAAAGVATHARMAAVNIWGTDNVLQAARDAGVARFVHVSTISVYGYTRRGVVDETARLHPIGEGYGDTKAIGERLALRSGLPATVVRPAQVYGPRSQPWTVRLIDLTRWFVPLVDGGRGTCHPIYIDDIVDLLVLAAHHPDAPGQVFNGSPDPPATWRDFLTGYGRMHGHSRVVSVPRWLLTLPLGGGGGRVPPHGPAAAGAHHAQLPHRRRDVQQPQGARGAGVDAARRSRRGDAPQRGMAARARPPPACGTIGRARPFIHPGP